MAPYCSYGKRTSYTVVTEGSLGGGTMAEALARCSPGSRESCENSQNKSRGFQSLELQLETGGRTILFINSINIYLVPTMW